MDIPNPDPQTTGSFSADGKRGSVTQSISFSGGTPTGPGFSGEYTLTVPAGNFYEISVSADDSAEVSGAGISASSHWDSTQKVIVSGSATSEYLEIEEGAEEVTFSVSYVNAGGPYTLSASVTSTRTVPEEQVPKLDDGDEECECKENCPMKTETRNGSVDFEQPFGRTPFAEGFSSGTLILKASLPTQELYSPAGLKYKHYLTRKVLSSDAETQSATISADGIWENVYEQGGPASSNAWKNSYVSVNSDGSVVEKLSDRTEISYDADGNLISVKSPSGVTLTAAQLGAEVIRDANGALRQIWSLADGLLDIVTDETAAERYEIRWYKNGDFSGKGSDGLYTVTGTPIKVFLCGKPSGTTSSELAFEITEKRGDTFTFNNRWEYNALDQEWIFTRGEAYRSSRKWEELASGNYQITETRTLGTSSQTFTEDVSPTNGNRKVGKTVEGVAEYAATRVTTGNGLGKIATETERSGSTRSYSYDAQGRVTQETLSGGFGGLSETITYTYAESAENAFPDIRPRRVVHKISGSVFKTETFSYNDDETTGRTETHTVTANGTTLTEETRYCPAGTGTVSSGRVSLEIRSDGTATLHEYSSVSIPASVDRSSNLGYTETVTEGVFENDAFASVSGKSTRVVRTFDTRGNETRTENYVHTGTDFELVSWENKTYAPTHKVVATERSDGKTTSADYICTGAVWTIDENGVRTDNTFDEAKRLKTSTRHGVRGEVVTTYGYDAEGRVVSETRTCGELSKTTSRTYDAFGDLSSETDALGNTTHYVRSSDGLTETVTFADGGTRITVRNAHGETLSVTGTATVAEYYAYSFDSENALKITTVYTGSASSARWEKTYTDGHGRTVKTERSGYGENVVLTTENTYSGTRLVSVVSTGKPSVAYAHDALGNVIATTQSTSSEWRKTETETVYEKDSDDIIWQKTTNTLSCSDETISAQTSVSKTQLSGLSLALESKQVSVDVRGNATVTTNGYDLDTKTRTQTTTFPQMTDAQTSVFVDGVTVSQTAPGSVTTSAVYDAFNRRTSSTDARGNVTTYAYDIGDRLVSQTQTVGEVAVTISFEYDVMHRRTKTIFTDGTFTASAYDLRGNQIAEYGNASYPVLFVYDELNQKTQMQTFRTLAGTPEELANLTGGDVATWSYDAATGLLLSKTDAAGKATVYTYTATGQLATRTWARGIVTTYTYDAWQQLTDTSYSDDTASIAQVYDALGRIVSVSDASGSRVTAYNVYGEVESETLTGDGVVHAVTELRDAYGRSTGYTYAKSGTVQQTVGTGYDAVTGRIATASFVHGGATKTFSYGYLAGTSLLETLTCPSNLTITQSYESTRDLVTNITIRRGASTNVVLRNYTYDTLGRPVTRSTSRNGGTQNDTFGYNNRSELTSATLGSDGYAYAFDYIGNRATSSEADTQRTYASNALNQYQAITETVGGETSYIAPDHDADGNAVLIYTREVGGWVVTYNGANRPIKFENWATETTVECGYDSQGRRYFKKVTVAGDVTLHHRYIYRGYLQIACVDMTRSGHPDLWLTLWDPTQPTATRPLAIQKDGTWFTYGYDITKNVCEVFGPAGYIRTTYSYTPFGAVTESGDVSQPFQWSSEHYDSELGLVYYNYRHYSPTDGRWLSRDPIEEEGGRNLYAFVGNGSIKKWDILGLFSLFKKSCCAGKTYSKFSQGCCGGVVYSKGRARQCCISKDGTRGDSEDGTIYSFNDEEGSGVFLVTLRGRGNIPLLLKHAWIRIGATNMGFYPNEDAFLYPLYTPGATPKEEDLEKIANWESLFKMLNESEVKMSRCRYDIEAFVGCVSSALRKRESKTYFLIGNNCLDWANDTIDTCKNISKRKE